MGGLVLDAITLVGMEPRWAVLLCCGESLLYRIALQFVLYFS